MIWYMLGDNYGLVRSFVEDPDKMTYVQFEIWSRSADGQPGEHMATYRDRTIAVAKMEMCELLRQVARDGMMGKPLTAESQEATAANV